MLSVFWATVVHVRASASSAATTRMGVAEGRRSALKDGSAQMLNVAATCAAAGHHRRRRRKTGLGLKFSAIVIAYAGGSLLADGAVHGADRLDHRPRRAGDRELHHLRGHRRARAHQARRARLRRAHVHLLLRGAVRSVAADGAVAVRRRGDHRRRSYRTTLQSWKYTLPAFVVPFVFVLDPAGVALLLKAPPHASWPDVAWIAFTAFVGIAALATGGNPRLSRNAPRDSSPSRNRARGRTTAGRHSRSAD